MCIGLYVYIQESHSVEAPTDEWNAIVPICHGTTEVVHTVHIEKQSQPFISWGNSMHHKHRRALNVYCVCVHCTRCRFWIMNTFGPCCSQCFTHAVSLSCTKQGRVYPSRFQLMVHGEVLSVYVYNRIPSLRWKFNFHTEMPMGCTHTFTRTGPTTTMMIIIRKFRQYNSW